MLLEISFLRATFSAIGIGMDREGRLGLEENDKNLVYLLGGMDEEAF